MIDTADDETATAVEHGRPAVTASTASGLTRSESTAEPTDDRADRKTGVRQPGFGVGASLLVVTLAVGIRRRRG